MGAEGLVHVQWAGAVEDAGEVAAGKPGERPSAERFVMRALCHSVRIEGDCRSGGEEHSMSRVMRHRDRLKAREDPGDVVHRISLYYFLELNVSSQPSQ